MAMPTPRFYNGQFMNTTSYRIYFYVDNISDHHISPVSLRFVR